MPKPIAPNPWRRGRRRTGGSGTPGNGAIQAEHSQRTLAPRCSSDGGDAGDLEAPSRPDQASGIGDAALARSQPHVIGLFIDRASAELACRALAARGYHEDAVKLMISEETCMRHFSEYSTHAMSHGGGTVDRTPRPATTVSHYPRPCLATVNVAVYTTPTLDATTALAEILSSSGLPYSRITEFEMALRSGAVLLSVLTRSHDDARIIDSEWRHCYRAEKVHS
jgi:hypothetical protein